MEGCLAFSSIFDYFRPRYWQYFDVVIDFETIISPSPPKLQNMTNMFILEVNGEENGNIFSIVRKGQSNKNY